MKKIKVLASMLVVIMLITGTAFAVNYKYRESAIRPTVEAPFQDYVVDTVSATNAAYVEASLTLTGIYANFVRLLNDSNYDALIKLNNDDAFTLQAGFTMSVSYDGITSVKVTSKTADTTIVEVSVWGRTDIDV